MKAQRFLRIVLLLVVGSICFLSGCKSASVRAAEGNIRAYIAREGRGELTITRIEHVRDQQNSMGGMDSVFEVRVKSAQNGNLSTSIEFYTDMKTGEIVDVSD